jgi:hypothetical protein
MVDDEQVEDLREVARSLTEQEKEKSVRLTHIVLVCQLALSTGWTANTRSPCRGVGTSFLSREYTDDNPELARTITKVLTGDEDPVGDIHKKAAEALAFSDYSVEPPPGVAASPVFFYNCKQPFYKHPGGVINSPPPWLRVGYFESMESCDERHNQLGDVSNNNPDGARDGDNDDVDEVNHAEKTETPRLARRCGHRPEYGDDETHVNSEEEESRSDDDDDYVEDDAETYRRKTKRRKISHK